MNNNTQVIDGIDNNNTTFCTGFWYIQDNIKRNLNHYLDFGNKTFNLLQKNNIVFFYEDEKILDWSKNNICNNTYQPNKINLVNLPTYEISQYYLESCKNQSIESLKKIDQGNEKGIAHYERDYLIAGENTYRKLFTIWTSKIFLVEKAIQENFFNTEFFAWVDISISRFNYKRENWNFIEQKYSENYIYHYDGNMKYYGKKININGSFIFGHKKKWLELVKIFKNQLTNSKNSHYAHDEETLLNLIYQKNTSLFYKLN